MDEVHHKFRDNLFNGWKSIKILNDSIDYIQNDKEGVVLTKINIDIKEIKSVRIVKNYGDSYSCDIVYGDNKKLRVHSGAIEKFGSPYQNLESFASFTHALLVRNNPKFTITIGSNALYYFSIGSLIVGSLVVLFAVIIAIFNDGMPEHAQWKMGFIVAMLALFSWPLMKLGKAKAVKELQELPYSLSSCVIENNNE